MLQSTRWDRSVRSKCTDQSAAAVVCLMSPPPNAMRSVHRAFTYIRLQRTDQSQRVRRYNFVFTFESTFPFPLSLCAANDLIPGIE